MPMTRMPAPVLALGARISTKSEHPPMGFPGPTRYAAIAKSAASSTGNDISAPRRHKYLKNLPKFCHASCKPCMTALLIHSLLCACSTIIYQRIEE
jgi:hypothetical protein